MVIHNKIKLCFYIFFHNLIFAYVIERLFWEQRGISIAEVVYLEIIYAFVVIILEIPTGYLADRFSRKKMMILAALATFIELFILTFAYGFLQFCLAIVVAAFGHVLASGTSNSLLYDSLKFDKKEHEFESSLSKLRFFDGLSAAVASVLGGFIAVRYSLVMNYYLSLISTIIALIITLLLIEPPIKTDGEEQHQKNYIKQTLTFFKGNPSLVIVTVNSFIVAATMDYIDEFWQLYLRDISFPIFLFGFLNLTTSLVGSIGGLFSYKCKKVFGYKRSFIIALVVFLIGLLGLGLSYDFKGIIFLILIYLPTGIIETLAYGYLHHKADSSFRATADSFQSLGRRIASIIIGLLFAFTATQYSITTGFLFLAIFICAFLIIYISVLNKQITD